MYDIRGVSLRFVYGNMYMHRGYIMCKWCMTLESTPLYYVYMMCYEYNVHMYTVFKELWKVNEHQLNSETINGQRSVTMYKITLDPPVR